MKSFLIALVLLTSAGVQAAAPEQDYWAFRDRSVAKFTQLDAAGKVDDSIRDDERRALEDLECQLRRIIELCAEVGDGMKG